MPKRAPRTPSEGGGERRYHRHSSSSQPPVRWNSRRVTALRTRGAGLRAPWTQGPNGQMVLTQPEKRLALIPGAHHPAPAGTVQSSGSSSQPSAGSLTPRSLADHGDRTNGGERHVALKLVQQAVEFITRCHQGQSTPRRSRQGSRAGTTRCACGYRAYLCPRRSGQSGGLRVGG